jgi:CHAT domain-containing protein
MQGSPGRSQLVKDYRRLESSDNAKSSRSDDRTGRGAKVTGEGLIGLTRAWQYAGARTVVSSQWKVSDDSAAALMTAFHRHVLAGTEKDEALRRAMGEVAGSGKGSWSEPYHWAAFVMVGDTGPMR